MTDKNLFKYYMGINNCSMKVIADAIGVNEATLYRKINGDSDFLRHEILTIKDLWRLSADEVMAIFFNV